MKNHGFWTRTKVIAIASDFGAWRQYHGCWILSEAPFTIPGRAGPRLPTRKLILILSLIDFRKYQVTGYGARFTHPLYVFLLIFNFFFFLFSFYFLFSEEEGEGKSLCPFRVNRGKKRLAAMFVWLWNPSSFLPPPWSTSFSSKSDLVLLSPFHPCVCKMDHRKWYSQNLF